MKTHTSAFKSQIKEFGKEIDSVITYTLNNEEVVLGNEQLNTVTPHYEGDILKSVMKQLDIDTNVEIPIGTELNYQFGVLINNSYEYIDYGNYIVYSTEKQEDTLSWKIVCYDKMLYAMKDYQQPVSNNLFDKDKISSVSNGTNNNGVITSTTNSSAGTKNVVVAFSSGAISVPANTTIYFSADIKLNSGSTGTFSNINDNVNGGTTKILRPTLSTTYQRYQTSYTYTSASSITSMLIQITNLVGSVEISNIMISTSSDATYVPYFNKYPITIKNYLTILANNIGLKLKDTNFVNQDKEIQNELYLSTNEDEEGNITYSSLDYKYRDVLDEIAGVTASTICINKDDELEVRYINATEGNNIYAGSENLASVIQQQAQMSKTGTGRECTMTKTSNGTASPRIQFDDDFFEVNTTYYISFKIKGNWSKFNFGTWINNSQTSLTGDLTPTSEYQTITCHFTYPSTKYTSDRVFFRNNDQYVSIGQTLTITDFMISKVDVPFEPYGADLINEEYLKDINVNFGEKYGPVNSIVFSRSSGSDNIYKKDDDSIEQNGLHEIKIVDNQILNSNNRDEFLDGIFNQLNGFEYYVNDYSSTGIGYYDLCDRYNVSIEDNIYSCVMLNDEFLVTQGLEENIHTNMPEKTETDYSKADTTDKRIKQAYIIVDKANQRIESFTGTVEGLENLVDSQGEQIDKLGARVTQTESEWKASVSGIQDQLDSGVGLVKTTSVTINNEGLSVSTDNSRISTTMTNDEFRIMSDDVKLAYFGYDTESMSSVAEMDNLTVTNYLTTGNHRIEKFERDGEQRTGFFYIGGN